MGLLGGAVRLWAALVVVAVVASCGQPPPEQEGARRGGGTTVAEATGGETTAEETTVSEPLTPGEGNLIVYSGRTEDLVGPLMEQFEERSGIDVRVRYGDTAELAATILEEGENSPADLFFAQDPGALGALAEEGRLRPLPRDILGRVSERFRSPEGLWVGTSGRARVVAYNTEELDPSELPESIYGFTDPEWEGRIGWAPTNGSFQAFVTALRVLEGEERARAWLEGIQANDPSVYPDNSSIVQAVGAGEVDVGFVNHYYVFRTIEEQGEDFPARNYFLKNGDPGALVLAAGTGILDTAENPEAAREFIRYLLSEEAQQYFADETYEYPLIEGVEPAEGLPPLSEIESPRIDLSDLSDLEGTLELLRETGVL
jgi:iron(III) transport system substrate-binding protein